MKYILQTIYMSEKLVQQRGYSAFIPVVSNTQPTGHIWSARAFCKIGDALWEFSSI